MGLLFSVLIVFVRCSADNSIVPNEGVGMKMVIKVDGVTGDVIQPLGKSAVASATSSLSIVKNINMSGTSGNNIGFVTEVQAQQSPMVANDNSRLMQSAIATDGKLISNLIAATQNMTTTYTYRILIYDNNTGELWNTVQATVGTEIRLDVAKGGSYTWYAYSYNDTSNIPAPANTANPTIDTAIDKDLLYATGSINIPVTPSGQYQAYPVNILFNHKVAQVKVRIDATVLAQYATINGIKASFVENNYIKTGTFDIKGNSMGNLQVVPTTDIFTTTSPTNIWEAVYYTADPVSLASYKINITDLPVTFKDVDASMANRNLATYNGNGPAVTPTFTFNFTGPTAGQTLLGVANLKYTPTLKRIVHYSGGSAAVGYASQSGTGWKFLQSDYNFGTSANSLVNVAKPWPGTTASSTTAAPANYTSSETTFRGYLTAANKPDIVIMGVLGDITLASTRTALVNYINGGGVVIMLYENTSYASSFLNELLGVTNITQRTLSGAGSMYPTNNTNDEILNGIFGDARLQYWGEDANFSQGILNLPTTEATIYAYGQAINATSNANNANAVSMFKLKNKSLFFVGDGGFTSNIEGNASSIICPFRTDYTNTYRPVPKPYGGAGAGYTAQSKSAYNSIIFGNVMQWAIKRAEYYGYNQWKYKNPPTP
ncbi:hypothetical protein BAZ10_01975 [Elizabethkingia occulta]|uniref:Uncharacterized protein n=2 Tax=Elizabethkingia occulta TaxID=1867263 RepID=A0A1T3MNX9_9FLAO|nr:hypothetical protein BB020_07035 [Elizabethkingia occulta]OPC66307.1 hypothetical protein BAZ10_01975 [Elizabethkingia occulta]